MFNLHETKFPEVYTTCMFTVLFKLFLIVVDLMPDVSISTPLRDVLCGLLSGLSTSMILQPMDKALYLLNSICHLSRNVTMSKQHEYIAV